MQTHTIDTRWVKIHFVEKILVFSIFHITSHFLCVTLRLAAPCSPSGSRRSGNPTTSSRAHLASALKSTAVFRLNGRYFIHPFGETQKPVQSPGFIASDGDSQHPTAEFRIKALHTLFIRAKCISILKKLVNSR